MNTLAIDIGGTKFSLALFDSGRMLERHSAATDRDSGPCWMLDRIVETAALWKRSHNIQRCGIGFGGPVLFDKQTIALSTHVGGWSGFPLATEVADRLGVPTIMDNDANVGALGESHHGAGQGEDPFFYMTLSTGIGGGILYKGEILRGADSYAGEIGHLNIDPAGPECLCGSNGCFERMCCGLWLERDHGRPVPELLANPEFVRKYVVLLARGLKACIMLLNPARIVIGGGISKSGDALFVPLRQELRRQITGWSRARISVVPAALGDDSVLYGACQLASQWSRE
jgi:glucokinase